MMLILEMLSAEKTMSSYLVGGEAQTPIMFSITGTGSVDKLLDTAPRLIVPPEILDLSG